VTALILASSSPRRIELTRLLGFAFDVDPSDVDETIEEATPETTVCRLAERKARRVAGRHPQGIVIGADTVVAMGDRILGKPIDRNAAVAAIRSLSGRTHDVHTGLCVIRGEEIVTDVATTHVTFRPLDEMEIQAYADTDEPYDKAGAYGIQGKAAVFVDRIEGCYYNVVGLPVSRLYRMLRPYRDHLVGSESPIDVLTALRDA